MIQDLPLKLAENTPYYKHLGIKVVEAEGWVRKIEA